MGTPPARSSRVVSISHCPVPPPIWASLPEDNLAAYVRPQPMLQVPATIHLDEGARCICGSSYRVTDQTTLRETVVYTLISAQRTLLEVQQCDKCPQFLRRSIGPDGCQLGLFNLNNNTLFTHDLLDDYTANFTSSETPFSAWVSTMRKRYARHGSLVPFAHDATFRNAWFSYSALQCLEGDMKCPRCGPAPEDVIWDGVSLSFHKKHLLPSLHPPTMVHENSLVCNSRYCLQAPIENLGLRQAMRKIISTTSLSPTSESGIVDSFHNAASMAGTVEKAADDPATLMELIFQTHESLKSVHESLATCFYSRISLTTIPNSGVLRCKEYSELFSQVRIYILNMFGNLTCQCLADGI